MWVEEKVGGRTKFDTSKTFFSLNPNYFSMLIGQHKCHRGRCLKERETSRNCVHTAAKSRGQEISGHGSGHKRKDGGAHRRIPGVIYILTHHD